MELAFEPTALRCLRTVADRMVNQEETAEAIVPDRCPDVVRTAGCYGMLVLRSKECRDGAVILSGGVRAFVLVVPEGETCPQALAVYLPFSIRVDASEITPAGQVCFDGHLRSIDARLLNSRKVLVRADIVGRLTVWEPSELTAYSLSDCPPAVQVHRTTMPLCIPAQTAEKPFAVEDELELSGGVPAVSELLSWYCAVSLTEQKLIGTRAVFKGSATVRMLYRSPSDEICRYECAVPFSQFAELEQEGEEDDLRTTLLLTGAELEPDGQEPTHRLRLSLNVLAQCVTNRRTELELIDDLYATRGTLEAQTEPFTGESLLDVQHLRQTVRGEVQGDCAEVVDTFVCLGWPETEQDGQTLRVRVPALVTVLYSDSEQQLQSKTERMEATCETALMPGCQAKIAAELTGEVFAAPSGGGAEARFTVEFSVECTAQSQASMVTAADLTETDDEPQRPSVVLRTSAEGETLWSIAKSCRSSMAAVSAANALDGDPVVGTLLLIPRV